MTNYKQTYKQRQERESSIDNLNALFGKMPPQAIDMEKAVLGAILVQADAIHDVISVIRSESFYVDAHREIFTAMKLLSYVCEPIDIITVSNKLRNLEKLEVVGGEIYLSELTDRIGTAAHIVTHARIIQQKYIQRELIRVSAEIQKKAFDDSEDLEDVINFAEAEMYKVTDVNITKEAKSLVELIVGRIDSLEKRASEKNNFSGVPSGFTAIDRVTNGFKDSNLIILAARPSMGKTALSLNIARNMAIDFNIPVAFFSLEMSEAELTDRLIVSETEIDGNKFKIGKLADYEWTAIENNIPKLEKAPLFVDDTAGMSIFELRSKLRKLVRLSGVKAAVVDYLQLMNAGSDFKGNRETEVSFISRNLKQIAKELDIPIIALSQLNRSVESRGGNKRPQLSDLRESGAIEQDADMVIFIHRPEYYGITQDEEGNDTRGLAEVIISKYRDGNTGIVRLKFNNNIVKFRDYDRENIISEPIADNRISKVENNDDIPTNYDFDNSPF